MSQTVGDAVDNCLAAWLLGTFSSQLNTLSTGISGATDATEINCGLPLVGIGTGAFIAIDNELMYVADTDQTNNRLIVIRGERGTTAAAHAADATIEVNPRFPRFLVREQMHKEILSWPDSLYNVQSFTATVGTISNTITIPSTVNGFVPRQVLRVRRLSLGAGDERYRRTEGYEVDWDNLTINLNEASGFDRTFRVQVGCAFDADALDDDDNDLADDVGITSGMAEILELGAAYRLLMGRGSVRLFPEAEGQSRVANEVGGTDIPRLASVIVAQKRDRMGEEAGKLSRRGSFGGT